MGRPSSFSEELGEQICQLIASGMSMPTICQMEEMPGHSTVMTWLAKGDNREEPFAAFLDNLVRARDQRQERIFEECLVIADGDPVTEAHLEQMGDDEQPKANKLKISFGDIVSRDRLRVETRLKMLAMMNPKKYGTKVTNEHTGENGKPIATTTSFDLSTLSVEQLTALSGIATSLNPAARESDGD